MCSDNVLVFHDIIPIWCWRH